ncbi:hypothetical protein C7121_09120 [Paenibacillus glucanolyticus]|nr:hypothetical protein C7121_09120 [Paenibacillus glucanolyticus]
MCVGQRIDKKKQDADLLCSKLIRILFGVMKKGHRFSEEKTMHDIPRLAEFVISRSVDSVRHGRVDLYETCGDPLSATILIPNNHFLQSSG